MINKLQKWQAAYLAGLVDGEGCVAVTRTNTSASAKGCKRGFSYRASIAIAIIDLEVLEWAIKITGVGKLCNVKCTSVKHRQAYKWTVWSNEAQELLKQLLPFLIVKKDQAKNLIEFQSKMRFPGRFGLSDKEWLKREEHWKKSQILNKRGKRYDKI